MTLDEWTDRCKTNFIDPLHGLKATYMDHNHIATNQGTKIRYIIATVSYIFKSQTMQESIMIVRFNMHDENSVQYCK